MTEQKAVIAILGGTGDLGGGLGWQLCRRGYPVVIGSRGHEKAAAKAAALLERAGGDADVRGMSNPDAAEAADIVFMTVPFASAAATLASVRDAVQGKIFVDATVPLVPPKVMRVQMPEGGSAGMLAQEFLGENVSVVSAFQNVAAAHLNADDADLDECDVLVTGNNKDAREVVVQLAKEIGVTAWHAGPINNSVVAEALTSVLIFMNKRYKMPGAGIKITAGHKHETS